MPTPAAIPTQASREEAHATTPARTGQLAANTRSGGGTISRDEAIRRAGVASPWEFIPLALQLVRLNPADDEARFHAAAHFTRLALRTPALEQLDRLSAQASALAQVRQLRTLVQQLPDDRVLALALVETCQRNVAALRTRGIDLSGCINEWTASLDTREFFRAKGGNIVVRSRASTPATDAPWLRLRDDAAEATAFPLPHLQPGVPKGTPTKPYTLEGIDPPWMLLRIYRDTPPGADGYRPRIRVLQADALEFLDGLALADLSVLISDDRVQWFIGEDAGARFEHDLLARLDTQITGPAITLATLRRRCTPTAEKAIASASTAQLALESALQARVFSAYRGRTPASWHDVFTLASTGNPANSAPARPLRVLIPTCRYSTFIQHSSRDLADAFNVAGHSARVLIEPDACSRLSSIAFLRAIDEFQPDMVVLVNYTRSHLEGAVPPELPFVSWFQDSMPHQFSAEVGAKLGPLDFIVGHMHAELSTQFGYPTSRRLSLPVAVSQRKFQNGPVEPALRAAHECELSFVSHHSESPEAMHERLMTEAGRTTPAAKVFDRLLPRVRAIAMNAGRAGANVLLRDAAIGEIRAVLGADPDERTLTHVVRQYCLPVADRVFRHQTLEWASTIAQRRGWRFNLHGRGWDSHPSFRAFARGELPHDESLRAAYQSAAVSLQTTINTPVHQRVMECAMSGGLPICRLTHDSITVLASDMYKAAVVESQPAASWRTRRDFPCYVIADSPGAMMRLAQLQRLGEPCPEPMPGWLVLSHEHAANLRALSKQPEADAAPLDWLLGDIAELTFRDEAGLEAIVERAIEQPTWRRAHSSAIAARVRRKLTHDIAARRIIELIRDSLASS